MTRIFKHENNISLTFYCPACKSGHTIDTSWQFDGNVELPTISPSVLLWDERGYRCHSFVKNGEIEFLSDCSHAMAGKTVPLPEIESLTYNFGK